MPSAAPVRTKQFHSLSKPPASFRKSRSESSLPRGNANQGVQLSAEGRSISLNSNLGRKPVHSTVAPIPAELMGGVLRFLPVVDMAKMRFVSRGWNAESSRVLRRLYEARLGETHALADDAFLQYSRTQLAEAPAVLHFKQYFTGLGANEILEMSWYLSPPEEVKLICECLCILYRNKPAPKADSQASVEVADEQSMTWGQVKKVLGKHEFKRWLMQLPKYVNEISLHSIQRVEQIIIDTDDINYDHIRRINKSAYQLLIVVGAVIQYCNRAIAVKALERNWKRLEQKKSKEEKFLLSVGGTVSLSEHPWKSIAPAA